MDWDMEWNVADTHGHMDRNVDQNMAHRNLDWNMANGNMDRDMD